MHFVDRNGGVERIDTWVGRRRSRRASVVDYDRCGAWANLGRERNGIGLERQQPSVGRHDFVFVPVARPGAGDKYLPVAFATDPHGVAPTVPKIEIANHADTTGIGRE